MCVRDIVTGVIEYEKVEKIIASTRADSPEKWDAIILKYSLTVWHFEGQPWFAERCATVARDLIARGLVEQPRLQGKMLACAHQIWVDNETQVRYR